MSSSIPTAKSVPSSKHRSQLAIRNQLKRLIQRRNLCGLSNDTKWDELISAMRAREGWTPKYRCKCVDGPPSHWDGEWFYHLPFPLISVEWLDIAFIQKTHRGTLIVPSIIDHSPWIIDLLQQIGLNYQKGRTMIRIHGYSPRSQELFDENPKV